MFGPWFTASKISYICIVMVNIFPPSRLQNVVMETSLPTSHLAPLSSSQNGSYHFVGAEKVGKATINATLNAVKVSEDTPANIRQLSRHP